MKGKGQGVDTYCLGLNNKINIVNPTFVDIQDYKGRELKITNYDVNTVLYRFGFVAQRFEMQSAPN